MNQLKYEYIQIFRIRVLIKKILCSLKTELIVDLWVYEFKSMLWFILKIK